MNASKGAVIVKRKVLNLLANPGDLAIVSLVRGILCVQVSPSVRVRRVLTRRVTESLKAAKVQVAHLVR